jgi:hypothetical protein
MKVRMTLIIKSTFDTTTPGNSKEEIVADCEAMKLDAMDKRNADDGMSDCSVEYTVVELEEDEGA